MIELVVGTDPVLEDNGLWAMEVRCITDIPTGAHLTVAISFTVDMEDGSVSEDKDSEILIDLVIEKIRSWEREFEIAYSGMAAKIYVLGDASRVIKNLICRGE
ncbi:hypothetical protein [Chitinimonas naiadis]